MQLNRSLKLIVLLMALSIASVAQDGLVGSWQLADLSGAGLNNTYGFYTGEVRVEADNTFGSVVFFGPDAQLTIPYDPALQPAIGTVQVWIRPTQHQNADVVTAVSDYLLRSNQPASVLAYGLRTTKQGRVAGCILNDDPSQPEPWVCLYSQPKIIKPNQWQLLSLRWDGSTVSIYHNGVLLESMPYLPIPEIGLSYHGTQSLYVAHGTDWGIRTSEYRGEIADLQIFNIARTQEQLRADFNVNAMSLLRGKSH